MDGRAVTEGRESLCASLHRRLAPQFVTSGRRFFRSMRLAGYGRVYSLRQTIKYVRLSETDIKRGGPVRRFQ